MIIIILSLIFTALSSGLIFLLRDYLHAIYYNMSDPVITSYFTNHDEVTFVLYMSMALNIADILQ